MIASHILIQAEAGPAAIVTAALGEVPGACGDGERGRALRRHRAGGDAGYRPSGPGWWRPAPRASGGVTRTAGRCPVVRR